MRQAVPGADFALLNSGGVRQHLLAGPVTFRDLYGVMPFENLLVSVQLSGAQVVALIRTSLAHARGIAQVDGLRLTLRCPAPGDERGRPALLGVFTADGRPLDPARQYRMVVTDFLLLGGDGLGPVFQALPAERVQVHRTPVLEALIRHLRQLPAPINSAARPVLDPARPPLELVGGPCASPPAGQEALCR